MISERPWTGYYDTLPELFRFSQISEEIERNFEEAFKSLKKLKKAKEKQPKKTSKVKNIYASIIDKRQPTQPLTPIFFQHFSLF